MTLEQLQQDFKRYLFDGDEGVGAAVVETQRLDSASRLQIYGSAYRARLVDVLVSDYPVLQSMLGERTFAGLSEEYIAAFPSISYTLRGFGARLAAFVESTASLPNRPFAVEMATFEWGLVEAFDARDQSVARIEDMARIAAESWPTLWVDIHPSVQTLDTRFNTLGVWNAVKANQDMPVVAALDEPSGCLIWRKGLTTVFRSTESDELVAWRVLAAGGDFSALCASLLERMAPDEVPMRAAALLQKWLGEGLIGVLHASRDRVR